ncbi:MAG TPA: YceI family protein [Balneolales bacterium]|nr:YceI family protein [Balneolales bacterium]
MLVLGLSTNLFAQQSDTVQFTIQPTSKIKVDGNSTLHKWSADAKDASGYFNIPSSLVKNAKVGDQFTDAKVTIPAKKLDSGEGGMNKKIYGAIKVKKYPNITYSLSSAKVVSVNDTSFTLDTNGNLTIHGTTKPIEMKVSAAKKADGSIHFTGSKDMKMSTFGVKPPTALFGTIKSDDEITVNFNVVAKEAPASVMSN